MSDAQDIIKEIEAKNQLFHGEYKEALEKTGNEYKESIVKMDAKFDTIQETMDKIEKSSKVQTISKEMQKDESNRKQCAEFVKGLRDMVQNQHAIIKTNEMVSVKEMKNYNSGDDANGGVFVMPFLDAELGKLLREFSMPRELASVVNISTDKWEQIVMNKVNGALWEKDMANFSDQTKSNSFNKLNLLVESLHAIAIFSDDLINDSAFDIVSAILTDIAEDMAIAEGLSYWTGNGSGELNGILTAPTAADSFNGIERVTSATANAIILDDVYDLVGSLFQRYQPNAQFKANRAVITEVRKLKDQEGQYLWQPSNQAGIPDRLAGYPISQAQELSSTITTGVEALVFGDFRQGTKIIDRMGMTVLRDNLTQYPNIAYKVKKRVGGGVVKGQALKILKQA
jgi:HK97 family phage major capsid protein